MAAPESPLNGKHTRVMVPLDEYAYTLAKAAAREVIEKHMEDCPITETLRRVRKVELRVAGIVSVLGLGSAGAVYGAWPRIAGLFGG